MNLNINSASIINIAKVALSTTQEQFTKYVQDIASGSLSSFDVTDEYFSDELAVDSVSKQVAIENAQQGMNLVSVADGALADINHSLTRIMELSAQASSDIYTAEQRASMQAEVDELTAHINSTIKNTQYNGKNILNLVNDSNPEMIDEIEFQVNSSPIDEPGISYDPNIEMDELSFDLSSVEGAKMSLAAVDNAINAVLKKQSEIASIKTGLMSSIENNVTSFVNVQSSFSQVTDADYALAMIGILQSQITQESLVAVLKAGFETQGNVLDLISGVKGK